MMLTPPQSRHRRAPSPPLSVAASSQFTTTPQPKLNVVARLALEGKAKQGDDGAAIRMYLKVSPLCYTPSFLLPSPALHPDRWRFPGLNHPAVPRCDHQPFPPRASLTIYLRGEPEIARRPSPSS